MENKQPSETQTETYGGLRIETRLLAGKTHVKVTSGRAKRPYAYYAFRTPEQAAEYVAKQRTAEDANQSAKAARKAERSAPHTLVIGDVLTYSWGCEQTNIDFFQVVGVKPHSVILRPICAASTGLTGNGMADHCIPVPDHFTGDAITKRVSSYGGGYVTMAHGGATKWDGQPEYRSWYA